jgi:hypothetical protein
MVWFSVVYLGEHYVVDVVAGVGLAGASWWVLNHVVAPKYRGLRRSADSLVPSPIDSAEGRITESQHEG